jgi:hypothetical protein
VPRTELTPERRADLVRNLIVAGWLLLGGSLGFITGASTAAVGYTVYALTDESP